MDERTAMIGKRKDRAIASILGFKESECDRYLPDEVSSRFRKVILDQINDLFTAACSQEQTPIVVLNEHYLDKINEMYEVVVNGR